MGTMTRMLAGAAVVASLTLGPLAPAAAQAPAAGTVTRVEGTAAVARTAIPQPAPLKTRDSLYLRDLLTTGEQSRAQLLLGGKATVTMRERSVLRITEDPGVSTVDITDGKLKLAVLKDRMKAGERVEVKTPNAVTAVRGTVVVVEVVRTASGMASSVAAGTAGAAPPATSTTPMPSPPRLTSAVDRSAGQAASDAAKLPPAGAGGRVQPGAPGAGPGLSGDDIRSRSGVIVPPTGGGSPTRGN